MDKRVLRAGLECPESYTLFRVEAVSMVAVLLLAGMRSQGLWDCSSGEETKISGMQRLSARV